MLKSALSGKSENILESERINIIMRAIAVFLKSDRNEKIDETGQKIKAT